MQEDSRARPYCNRGSSEAGGRAWEPSVGEADAGLAERRRPEPGWVPAVEAFGLKASGVQMVEADLEHAVDAGAREEDLPHEEVGPAPDHGRGRR